MSVWFARVRCHLLNDRGWPWNWRAVQRWAKRRARPCGIDVRGDRCSCGHADFFHRCEECGCEAFAAASPGEQGQHETKVSTCAVCGTADHAEIRNRSAIWGDGDVWCTRCDQKIRDWDSG